VSTEAKIGRERFIRSGRDVSDLPLSAPVTFITFRLI